MSLTAHDHDTILDAIQRWPRDAQLALAREILQAAAASSEETKGRGWGDLVGLFATGEAAPSDEELERWREEWRMEKYGR